MSVELNTPIYKFVVRATAATYLTVHTLPAIFSATCLCCICIWSLTEKVANLVEQFLQDRNLIYLSMGLQTLVINVAFTQLY